MWKLLLYILISITVKACCAKRDNCPSITFTSGMDLAFHRQPMTRAITCNEHYVELYCCVEGQTRMQWQMNYKNTWINMTDILSNRRYYKEDNQTLVLEAPLRRIDEGPYKCQAWDENDNYLENNVTLEINDCTTWLEPPVPVLPVEDNATYPVEFHGNFTLSCRGFFGRNMEGTEVIIWTRQEESSADFTIVSMCSTDMSSKDCRQDNSGMYLQSDLTVENVTEDDLGVYKCILKNPIGQTNRTITVIKAIPTPQPVIVLGDLQSRVIALTLGSALGIFLVFGLVYWKWGLDLKLAYRDRFHKPLYDGKPFDAFLVYNKNSQHDHNFVFNELLYPLEDSHGYNLCIHERDFIPGEPIANNYMNAVKGSRCLLFILSKDLLQDEWSEFTFQHAVAQKYRNMIFLVRDKIPKDAWRDDQKPMKKALKVSSQVVHWPTEVDKKRFALPLLMSTKKRSDIFWKKLRLYLPPRNEDESYGGSKRSKMILLREVSEKSTSSEKVLV